MRGGVDLANNKLQFDLVVDTDFTREVELNFDSLGSQWTGIGVEFNADARVDVNASVDLALNFGVGLNSASGVDPFFNLTTFTVDAAIAGSGSNLGFNLGNGTITGSASAPGLSIQAGVNVSLANGSGPISDRLNITPSGALNVALEFTAALFGTPLVNGASGLPSIDIVDTNLFDSTPPTFTVDMAPLTLNLSAETLIAACLRSPTGLTTQSISITSRFR